MRPKTENELLMLKFKQQRDELQEVVDDHENTISELELKVIDLENTIDRYEHGYT